MDKSERQEISCNKWRDAKGRGTLNLIMRFGKTRVAAMIVGKLVKANPNRTIMAIDRKSTRLNSSHPLSSRMPSSA